MGGRIYDPITARFLSPDPFVQSPDNLQNLNRYSYVLNNPLSFTDPSGFFFKGLGKWLKNNWKTIAAVAVGAVLAFVAAPALLGSFGSLAAVQGATFGFGSAFSGTLLAGGSVGDALRAGLKGGAIGGISAGAADLVGTGFSAGGRFAEYAGAKPFVHGVVQGGIRQATGGKFVHGFLSGTFADLAGSAMGNQSTVAARTAVASVIGGTAEVIGGGKFGNGAITGAFVHLFNTERHYEPKSYDSEDSRYHSYGFDKVACSTDLQGCSVDGVFDKILHHPTPFNDYENAISDGQVSDLGGAVGSVTHRVNASDHTLYNITNADHILHDGYVRLHVYQSAGKVYIGTFGEGINSSVGMSYINTAAGAAFWDHSGRIMRMMHFDAFRNR